jgi:hypothetical protein
MKRFPLTPTPSPTQAGRGEKDKNDHAALHILAEGAE